MPIPVACQCGAKFAAQDKLAGKRVKCPKCGEPLAIPAADASASQAATPKAAASPRPTSSAAKTAPKTPKPAASTPAASSAPSAGSIFDEIGLVGSKTGVKCPKCGADMQPGAILCIACGYNTQTGKQVETYSDSKAIAKREEIYQKQREASEKAAKAKGFGSGGKGSGSSYGERSGLSWVREQGSFGEVWTTTREILNSPTSSFSNLPPTGGTGLAIMFPVMTQLWVAGIWFFIRAGFMTVRSLRDPDFAAAVPLMLGLQAAEIGVSFVLNLVFLPLYGVLIAGLAHLVMMAGGTQLSFGATFRVVMYTMGACIGICVLPCLVFTIPIVWPIVLAFALSAHHRVGTGIGFGGSLLGLIVATPVYIVIVLMIYVAVIAAVLALLMGAGAV